MIAFFARFPALLESCFPPFPFSHLAPIIQVLFTLTPPLSPHTNYTCNVQVTPRLLNCIAICCINIQLFAIFYERLLWSREGLTVSAFDLDLAVRARDLAGNFHVVFFGKTLYFHSTLSTQVYK